MTIVTHLKITNGKRIDTTKWLSSLKAILSTLVASQYLDPQDKHYNEISTEIYHYAEETDIHAIHNIHAQHNKRLWLIDYFLRSRWRY